MGVTYTRILRYGFGLVGILLLGLTIADLGRPAGVPALPRIGTETPAEGDIARQPAEFTGAPPVNSWYFAVSGDSRDCGDVIMPKIAASVATKAKQMPVKFYWHLGDFRAFYRIDCDLAKRKNEATKCAKDYDPYQAIPQDLQPTPDYVNAAWQDFIDRQVLPFEKAGIPFYLGIGNHELIKRTPAEYTATFKKWLTQPAIVKQQKTDVSRKIPPRDSQTYFHFVLNGVDFILLDNADIYNQDPGTHKPEPGFSDAQLTWLKAVLQADAANPKVRSVVVGMHAALPGSVSRKHAMDKTCESLCHGYQAYAYISDFKKSGKPVLVLASHSHYIESNIYDTPEHTNDVLSGWIIGTAGAEQYRSQIRYGYLLVEVKSNGQFNPSFQEVKADPADQSSITKYCFEKNNKEPDPNEKYFTKNQCACN
jgi:hypothetical protein